MSISMTVAKNEKGLSQGKKGNLNLIIDNTKTCSAAVWLDNIKKDIKSIFLDEENGSLRKKSHANPVRFLKDFEEIVHLEMQKAIRCIDGIGQEIIYHEKALSAQLHTLKYLWRLVPPSKYREERAIVLMNKVFTSKEKIAEGIERAFLVKQRILILQKSFRILYLFFVGN